MLSSELIRECSGYAFNKIYCHDHSCVDIISTQDCVWSVQSTLRGEDLMERAQENSSERIHTNLIAAAVAEGGQEVCD